MKKILLPMLLISSHLISDSKSSPEKQYAIPPSLYNHEGDPSVYFSGAYIYWQPKQEGLAVATSGNYTTASLTNPVGNIIYPTWKTVSGFKAGIGGFLPADGWRLGLEGTYFVNSSTGAQTYYFTSGAATSLWTDNSLISTSANWRSWFYRLDLGLDYTFFVGHYITLTPYAGLIGLWTRQKLAITEDSGTSTNIQSISSQYTRSGGGTLADLCINFYMLNSPHTLFSFFINGGTGILLTESSTITVMKTGQSPPLIQQNFKDTLFAPSPMLEAFIGFRWESFSSQTDTFALMIEIGWEVQTWLGFNRFTPYAVDRASGGTFSMQGLTCNIQAGF